MSTDQINFHLFFSFVCFVLLFVLFCFVLFRFDLFCCCCCCFWCSCCCCFVFVFVFVLSMMNVCNCFHRDLNEQPTESEFKKWGLFCNIMSKLPHTEVLGIQFSRFGAVMKRKNDYKIEK